VAVRKTKPLLVIPGRGDAANPESSNRRGDCGWIPGPLLCSVPE